MEKNISDRINRHVNIGGLAYVSKKKIDKVLTKRNVISITTRWVTWGMTAPGGKRVPPQVDNLKLPRTLT